MSEMIWANALLVMAGAVVRGAVRAVDGRIVEIDEGHRVPARAVDCEGCSIADTASSCLAPSRP